MKYVIIYLYRTTPGQWYDQQNYEAKQITNQIYILGMYHTTYEAVFHDVISECWDNQYLRLSVYEP